MRCGRCTPGARDFLIKPFEVRTLEEAVARRAEAGARERARDRRARVARPARARWLLGNDPALLPALSMLAKVADTRCTVLITGESGTGKELAARSLHAGSARAKRAVRRGQLRRHPGQPGRVRAVRSRARRRSRAPPARASGRFAQADGGTILLDEIGEMEPDVQAKLLRLIQDGELYPVGEETPTQSRRPHPGGDQPQPGTRGRRAAASAPTCSGASTSSPSSCPRCASAPATSCRWREHFLATRQRAGTNAAVAGFDPQATGAAQGVQLARQHPRARERRRARW